MANLLTAAGGVSEVPRAKARRDLRDAPYLVGRPRCAAPPLVPLAALPLPPSDDDGRRTEESVRCRPERRPRPDRARLGDLTPRSHICAGDREQMRQARGAELRLDVTRQLPCVAEQEPGHQR